MPVDIEAALLKLKAQRDALDNRIAVLENALRLAAETLTDRVTGELSLNDERSETKSADIMRYLTSLTHAKAQPIVERQHRWHSTALQFFHDQREHTATEVCEHLQATGMNVEMTAVYKWLSRQTPYPLQRVKGSRGVYVAAGQAPSLSAAPLKHASAAADSSAARKERDR